jgi:hypothetical protein
MQPDEPNDEERLEELPGDSGQTPFRPADPPRDDTLPPDDSGQPGATSRAASDDTHPDGDTDVDRQELYDAGEASAAAGADEPHDDTTVTGYNPPDQPESPS